MSIMSAVFERKTIPRADVSGQYTSALTKDKKPILNFEDGVTRAFIYGAEEAKRGIVVDQRVTTD